MMNEMEHDDEKEKVSVPVGRPKAIRDEELPEEPDEEEELVWEIPRSWYVY